jgi:diaminopimelate epimerase
MHIEFYKYQGTGNDFVMIDNRSNFSQTKYPTHCTLMRQAFGIGGDGLILLENDTIASNLETATDFKMVYYNSDGKLDVCGNGGRCLVAFAKSYS